MSGAGRPQELVEQALAVCRADSCVVIGDYRSDANLRWANNSLTTNGVSRSHTLTVVAVVGGATGVVSRRGVTAEEVGALVAEAEHTAAHAARAGDLAPLAGPAAGAGWDDPPAETSIDVFDRFAPDLGAALAQSAAHDELLFGYAAHELQTTYVATSSGFRGRSDQPTGHVEINAKSSDRARSAWVGVASADFGDVDVAALTGDLRRRLAWAERRLELPAGRYDTVLPPTAVADLMISLYWSAGARDAADGRTVFSRPGGGTRVGDRLSATAVNLRSDPAARSLECTPFVVARQSGRTQSVFDNGLHLAPTRWVEGGVLRGLVQTRQSAAVTGLAATPYIDNLILDGAPSGPSLEQLVAGTDRALLLTCLWYIRDVDPQTLLLTGLTRDGVYLVERGEVVGAVNNFRFNESPVDLLGRIGTLGATERTLPREWCGYFTRTAMPAMLVEGYNMSSVSPAS